MSQNFIYALIVFAVIGAASVVYFVIRLGMTVWNVLRNLNNTLREAVELLKVYRSDFAVLRTIQETGSQWTPPPLEQANVHERERTTPTPPFPPPMYERFASQPPAEVDAEMENVDVTGDESDFIEREKIDTLREQGYEIEDSDVRPPGREVDAS